MQTHEARTSIRSGLSPRWYLVVFAIGMIGASCGAFGGESSTSVDATLLIDAPVDDLAVDVDVSGFGVVAISDPSHLDDVALIPADTADWLESSWNDERGVLVAGWFGKCMEFSELRRGETPESLLFVVDVAAEDRNTACAHSPLTINVWDVPASELGDVEPADIEVAYQRGSA